MVRLGYRLGTKARWIYRTGRANWLGRLYNRLWVAVAAAGITRGYVVALEVPGRRSGRPVRLPLVPAVVKGERYLVAMLGESSGWVRNARAAGLAVVIVDGRRKEVRLEEVPVAERAPILKAYLRRAPGGRPHIPVDKDAPLAAFAAVAAQFPAFRIVPRDAG